MLFVIEMGIHPIELGQFAMKVTKNIQELPDFCKECKPPKKEIKLFCCPYLPLSATGAFSVMRTVFFINSSSQKIPQTSHAMKEKKLSELTDQELLEEAKKMKSKATLNAVLIGFLVGIIFYSFMKNSLGFFTLIPLFFAYKLINNSNNSKELEALLKQRNLK